MQKLENFLELPDLERMRLVSRSMNQVVLCHSTFLSKFKLVLSRKNRAYEHPWFETSIRPKNLAFETIQTNSTQDPFKDDDLKKEEIKELVCQLVETCEKLEIIVFPWIPFARDTNDVDEIMLPPHFPPVLDVISRAKNLKELKLGEYSLFFLNNATEEHADALSGIQIIEFNTSKLSYCPPIFLKLRGLRMIRGRKCGNLCNNDLLASETRRQNVRFSELYLNNRETLVELDLQERCDWCCSNIFDKIFPVLKSLSLNLDRNRELALEFLENYIDKLEELDLIITRDPGADTIQTVHRTFEFLKCTGHLKKLEYKNTGWTDREMTIDIFSLLPISLRSLHLKDSFNYLFDYSKLKNFPLLTHLRLDTILADIDSFLETIFKYLIKLISLKIHSYDSTVGYSYRGFAFPGYEPWESDYETKPKRNAVWNWRTFALNDLVKMYIKSTYRISEDFITGIKCPKLVEFQIYPNELSPKDLRRLCLDNPCLKSIICGKSAREIVGGRLESYRS